MTGPGPNPMLLRAAFSDFCTAEARALGRGPTVPPQAAEQLLRLLIAGRLRAWQPGRGGADEEIPTEHWEEQAESFWPDISQPHAFPRVVVDEDELRAALTRPGAVPHQAPELDPLKAKRGRPPAADPYNVAVAVGSVMYTDGLNGSQEAAIDKIITRYNEIFGDNTAPARSTLKPMVSNMFREFRKSDAEVDRQSAKGRK